MKVEKINAYTAGFKSYLRSRIELHNKYKYEALQNWHDNWDISAPDFHTRYNNSLHSKTSANLWGGSKDSAKSVMLQFIKENDQFIRMAFKDLFDEGKDLGLRWNRFVFHLDDMLIGLQQKDKLTNTHFHDKSMVSVYLSFQYPEKYCIWEYSNFEKAMRALESRDIPKDMETERYYKSLRGIYKIGRAHV